MRKLFIISALTLVAATIGTLSFVNSKTSNATGLDQIGLANLQALTTGEAGSGNNGYTRHYADCQVPMHIASKAIYNNYETYVDCMGNEYVKDAKKYCTNKGESICITRTCSEFEDEMNRL